MINLCFKKKKKVRLLSSLLFSFSFLGFQGGVFLLFCFVLFPRRCLNLLCRGIRVCTADRRARSGTLLGAPPSRAGPCLQPPSESRRDVSSQATPRLPLHDTLSPRGGDLFLASVTEPGHWPTNRTAPTRWPGHLPRLRPGPHRAQKAAEETEFKGGSLKEAQVGWRTSGSEVRNEAQAAF